MKKHTIPHYKLDNSAILHLAAMRKHHTNLYRMTLTLTEEVNPEILQKALNEVTPNFPMIMQAFAAISSSIIWCLCPNHQKYSRNRPVWRQCPEKNWKDALFAFYIKKTRFIWKCFTP